MNRRNGAPADDPDPTAFPYWATQVTSGGPVGGILAGAAVDSDARRIHFATAPGCVLPCAIEKPTVHTLDMDTGAVVWDNRTAPGLSESASFAPTTGVPGVVFTGTVPGPFVRAFDAADGTPLLTALIEDANPILSAVASGSTVVDGTLLVGTGIGIRQGGCDGGSCPGDFTSRIESPVAALCVPGTRGCNPCQDGRDNDADGLVDFPNDPGCQDPRDATETANTRPRAEAGPDQELECASPAGALAMLDGSGASDPDGDALAYGWSTGRETLEGERVTARFGPGEHLATLVVDDGALTDFDTVEVAVLDRAAPALRASLTELAPTPPAGKDKDNDKDAGNRREFLVALDCTDVCDAAPSVVATVDGEPVSDGDVVSTGGEDPLLDATCTDAGGNTVRVVVGPGEGPQGGYCGLGFEIAPLAVLLAWGRRRR